MAMLLIDIGNTRIKWARFDKGRLGARRAATHAGWRVEAYERRVIGAARGVTRVLVASVAGKKVDRALGQAARRAGIKPAFSTWRTQ